MIDVRNPSESDLALIDALWHEYDRIQLRTGDEFEEQHSEVEPRSKAEEVHAWEDWACERLGLSARVLDEAG